MFSINIFHILSFRRIKLYFKRLIANKYFLKFNFTSNQINANRNNNRISFFTYRVSHTFKLETVEAGTVTYC